MFLGVFLKYKKSLAFVFFLAIIANLLSLVVPLSFMAVIDRVLVSSGFATLNVIFIALLLIAFSEMIINCFSKYISHWCGTSIISEIAGMFFNHLFNLKREYFHTYNSSDTLSRIRELDTIKAYISNWLLTYSVDIIFMIIFLFVMLSINSFLTWVILATVPLHIMQYFIFSRTLKKKDQNVFETSIKYNASVLEPLSGIEVIKNEGKEEFAINRIFHALNNNLKNNFSLLTIRLLSEELSVFISKVSEAAILFFGAYLVLEQKMTLGELVAFQMMKDRVTRPLLRTASLWEEIMQFNLSKRRVNQVIKEKCEVYEQGISLNTLISSIVFSDVSFFYDKKKVISNFNFEIRTNSITCIIGESGAGKSTVLRLLSRLYDNYEGDIKVSGIDIRKIKLSSLRKNIAHVNQECMLFTGTIRDNILFSSERQDDEWLFYCAKLASIDNFIMSLPLGYDTPVIEKGENFSGGQVQRLVIARAIASDKPILILDEATSALDYSSEDKIIKNLKKLSENKTIIAITHRLSLARCADKIVCMENGQIIEEGTHQELSSIQGFYHDMYEISNSYRG